MATAEESFRQGDLAACLALLQADVRRRPEDVRQRVFLVQVQMVLGQWERALTQLGVLKELDATALPMVHSYGAAIQCERLRAAVFRGERSPLLFGGGRGLYGGGGRCAAESVAHGCSASRSLGWRRWSRP